MSKKHLLSCLRLSVLSRVDSVSLVSRQSVLAFLLVFLTAFSGNVWADYVKVTSTAEITDGEYLIVYPGDNTHNSVAFNGSLDAIDVSSNGVAVTISDNKIASSETIDAATFTIDATAKTIQSASGYYIGQTSYGNGLVTNKTTSYTHSAITIDDSGNAIIKITISGNKGGDVTIRYNYASDQLRFRYYKSGQQAVQLFKKNAAPKNPGVYLEPNFRS